MTKEISREHILLRAAYQLLKKQDQSHYVLNLLEEDTVWDEATCDGYCLMEEAKDLLEEVGINPDSVYVLEENNYDY